MIVNSQDLFCPKLNREHSREKLWNSMKNSFTSIISLICISVLLQGDTRGDGPVIVVPGLPSSILVTVGESGVTLQGMAEKSIYVSGQHYHKASTQWSEWAAL